jgi:hypothetical protein
VPATGHRKGENVIVGGIELLPGEFELELTAGSSDRAIGFLPGWRVRAARDGDDPRA